MSEETLRIVQVTGAQREVVEPRWLSAAERVHRQLRPQLPADYAEKMRLVFRDRGCPGLDFESGTQRTRAHRFCFRERFLITAFSFRKEFR